jgi:hypothetical protein
MIFASKSEQGVPAWMQVKNGNKVITRRMHPEPIGSIRAVCPGRGKKAKCHILITGCMLDSEWMAKLHALPQEQKERVLQVEARKEGFVTWAGVLSWFFGHYKAWPPGMWRIEFELWRGPR